MSTVLPGWYPNPNDPHETRYWDGQAWTSSTQRWSGTEWVPVLTGAVAPGAVAPGAVIPGSAAQPGVPRKRRKTGLIIGLIAGGLIALLVGTIVVVNNATTASDVRALSYHRVVKTDERAGYDYTAPATELTDRSQEFLIRTKFDPYDVPAWVEEEGGDPSNNNWAVRVFGDEALNVEIPISAFSSYNRGTGIGVVSGESRYAAPYDRNLDQPTIIRSTQVLDDEGEEIAETPDINSISQGAYTRGDWGLYNEYYLVRYIDENGAKLERPVVSKFSFEQQLASPTATIVADDSRAGAAKFSWDAVPGADHYIVVKSYVDGAALEVWDGDLVSRDYVAIAETVETSWSTVSQTLDRFGNDVYFSSNPYISTQNEALEMFSVSADEFVGDSLQVPLNHEQIEYGVIAVAADGTTSAFGRASLASSVAALPYTLAQETLESLGQCGGGFPYASECGSPDQLLTYVPYTGLDGSVRVTPARMDTTPWKVIGDRYIAAIFGEGTDLGYWASFPVASVEDFAAAAESFNERSRLAAPQAGLVETQIAGLTTVVDPVSKFSDASADQTNGSNELVDYIAAHMIDGHEAIDMSPFSEDWTHAEIWDALREAYWQNPIAAVRGYDYNSLSSVVIVQYEDNREARVSETNDAIDRIIAEIITDGMSESEKVTAINTYLVDNIEYDYEAADAALLSVPDSFSYAWTLSGALLDGKVVCVGYAQAFKALADAAGLDSVVVTGAVVNSAVGHAWNKVEVDGEWYVVDSTWNDGPDPTQYLMVSDSLFSGDNAREYDTDWVYDLYADQYATK